jgi:hypothetical protein
VQAFQLLIGARLKCCALLSATVLLGMDDAGGAGEGVITPEGAVAVARWAPLPVDLKAAGGSEDFANL